MHPLNYSSPSMEQVVYVYSQTFIYSSPFSLNSKKPLKKYSLNTVIIAKGSLQEKQKKIITCFTMQKKGGKTIWWSNYASLICLLEILILLWSSCLSYNWFSDYSISFHVHIFSARGCLYAVWQSKIIWIRLTPDWDILNKMLLLCATNFF